MRSQAEIVARVDHIRAAGDVNPAVSYGLEALLGALDVEHASPLLPDGVIDWPGPASRDSIIRELQELATGEDSPRLLDRLGQLVWLLELEDELYRLLRLPPGQQATYAARVAEAL